MARATLLLIGIGCAAGAARAATCTSTATGNWNNPGIWSCTGSPAAPGGIPGTNDAVNIGNVAHTVTVTDNRTANSLQFSAGNQASNLAISSGVKLTVNGTMTVTGQNAGSGVRLVDVLAGGQLQVGGDLLLVGGSSNTRDVELRLEDATSTSVSVAGDLAGTAGGGDFNSASRVNVTFVGQGTVTVGGNLGGTANLAGGNGTFVFNGAGAQSIGSYNTAARSFNHVTISKSGGTATLAGDIRVRGDLTDNGNFSPATGNRTVTFAGPALQNIAGSAAATAFYRVALDNAGNLALAHDVSVSNRLTLTNGAIVTGTAKVSVTNGSAIVGAGGVDFVDGNLEKPFAAGSTSRTFEVGTMSDGQYAPVTVAFASVSIAGNVTVASIDGDHPDLGSSDIDGALSVNRYWRISNGGVAFTSYSATFTFGNPGDLDAGVDPLVVIAERRSPVAPGAGSWNPTTLGARTTTTHQITGETGFDDFAVGTRSGVTPGIGRFNAYESSTPAGQVTGVIQTKIAGASFNLDLVAVNLAGTAIQTGYTNTVVVQLLDASDDSGTLGGDACRSSWTVIRTLSPSPQFTAGDNGRITINVAEAEAWRDVRVRVSQGTRAGCSTDAFAIRPSAFANFGVSHGAWDTPGATALGNTAFAAGGELHKAGRGFTVVATAVNGAAAPAATTNYAGSPTPVLSACGGAACTASFGSLVLGAAFSGGQLSSTAATYSEVGAFNVRLEDAAFADVDAADGSVADCSGRYVCSATLTVGRFVPDRFAVAKNTPVFGTECGGFTYVGQKFNYTVAPVATLVAENAAGDATTLYTGTWWRISTATLANKAYSAAIGTIDASGVTGTDPAIADAGSGTGSLTFGSGSGLAFNRVNPAAPFSADVSLAIDLTDADGVSYTANPVRFGLATAGNGIAFSTSKEMRFGRLRLVSSRGSQLVPLALLMELQYWNGTAFVTNTGDGCTTIAAGNIEMKDYTQALGACETSLVVGAFAAGRATARLTRPGAANAGSVTLVPHLEQTVGGTPQTCIAGALQGVAGANRPYLEGKWDSVDAAADGRLYDDSPVGRATFGVYPGSQEVIQFRENF